MRVYISGPITGVEDYKERFAAAEKKLKEQGHFVINPIKIDDAYPEFDYEDYMEVDLCLLNLCEAIFLLPGWQQSAGANREYGYALAKEYEVML